MAVAVCKQCKKSLHTSNFRSSVRNGTTIRFGVCNNCMLKPRKPSDFSPPVTSRIKEIDAVRKYWSSRGVTVKFHEDRI